MYACVTEEKNNFPVFPWDAQNCLFLTSKANGKIIMLLYNLWQKTYLLLYLLTSITLHLMASSRVLGKNVTDHWATEITMEMSLLLLTCER